MVQSKLLKKYHNLCHGFGEKKDTFSTFALKGENVSKVVQVHSNTVTTLTNPLTKKIEADGMITNKVLYLSITTADCIPLFLYAPKKGFVGAIHAGWKGLSLGVVENAITQLRSVGVRPQEIIASIGPHIGKCCYTVEKKRVQLFEGILPLKEELRYQKDDMWHLDIGYVAKIKLATAGVREENIDDVDMCTSCDKHFYSVRREGVKTGRVINVIGIKN